MFSLSMALKLFARRRPGRTCPSPRDRRSSTASARRRSRCGRRRTRRWQRDEHEGRRGRIPGHRPPHRTLVPSVPAARRGQLADGGVARQGHGRADVPGLQRRAAAIDAAPVHRCRQDHLTSSGSCTSTSCTRFLGGVKPAGRGADAGRQVLKEIRTRLELLLGIGLDYLSLNRRSARCREASRSGSGCRRRSARA